MDEKGFDAGPRKVGSGSALTTIDLTLGALAVAVAGALFFGAGAGAARTCRSRA